jgi:hypothetical protein
MFLLRVDYAHEYETRQNGRQFVGGEKVDQEGFH